MTKRFLPFFAISLLLPLLAPSQAESAQAKPVELQTPKTLFTDLATLSAGKPSTVIMDSLIELIDAAPAESQIHLSIYEFDYPSLVNAFLRADSRGVKLHLMIDQNPGGIAGNHKSLRKLEENLSDRSEVFPIINDTREIAINHNKFLLFSELETTNGRQENIIFQTSHNFTQVGTRKFQDAIILAHKDLYQAYLDTWNVMKTNADGGMKDYAYREFSDPEAGITAAFLPKRKNGQSFGPDPIEEILNSITQPAQTKIRIGMSIWSDPRLNLVKKLHALKDQGAQIEIVTKTRLGKKVYAGLQDLAKKGAHFNRMTQTNIHSKIILIDGYLNGEKTRLLVNGTQNFTGNGLRYNNETTLILKDHPAFDAYWTALEPLLYKAK